MGAIDALKNVKRYPYRGYSAGYRCSTADVMVEVRKNSEGREGAVSLSRRSNKIRLDGRKNQLSRGDNDLAKASVSRKEVNMEWWRSGKGRRSESGRHKEQEKRRGNKVVGEDEERKKVRESKGKGVRTSEGGKGRVKREEDEKRTHHRQEFSPLRDCIASTQPSRMN